MVQWLRLHAPKVRGLSSIPGQGTRFHMFLLRDPAYHTKSQHNQRNTYFFKKINGISFLVILLLISARFIDMPAFWAALEEPRGPHSHTWYFSAGCGMELLVLLYLAFVVDRIMVPKRHLSSNPQNL